MPASQALELLPPEDPRWAAFAFQQPQANIFHHPAWLGLLADCYHRRAWIAACLDARGDIAAGVPLMEAGRWPGGQRWVSLPFSDHCIPLARSPEALQHLLAALRAAHQSRGLSALELRWDCAGFQTRSAHVLHTIPLQDGLAVASQRVHSMHRRNARAAEKRGVCVDLDTSRAGMEAYYHLHLETRQRQGVPIQPRLFFELLSERLVERGLGFVLLARSEGRPLAGAVFLAWGATLTYKYGASTLDGLNLRPNDLIFWRALQWGCQNGFAALDLGRTDLENEGLREFKSRWGAQEQALVYSYVPAAPQQTTSRWLPWAQFVIRRSPRWVCRAMGEVLYRVAAG